MTHRLRFVSATALSLGLLTACGTPNPVEGLALAPIDESAPPEGPSAPQLFVAALSVALNPPDDGCPTVENDGTTVTIRGGCTTDQGVEYVGTITHPASTVPGFMNGTMTYAGFGTVQSTACASRPEGTARSTTNGTVIVSTTGTTSTFDVDLAITGSGVANDCFEGEREAGILYTGTVVSDGGGNRTTWNGSGQIGGNDIEVGGGQFTGRYEVTTVDEVLDNDVCETEALSGRTTVVGQRTVEIRYDGMTDCDPESTATWTLDGVDQADELTGVRCSASPGRSASHASALAFVLVGLLLGRRRANRPRGQ